MIRLGGYLYYRLSCASSRLIGNLVDVLCLCILLDVLRGKLSILGSKLMIGSIRERVCLHYHWQHGTE